MPNSEQQIHFRRLLQLVTIAEVTLVVIGLKLYFEGSHPDSFIILATSILMLGVLWLIRNNKHEIASLVFITLLSTTIMLVQWVSGGIVDSSVVALPGILIFAAMIGAIRVYNFLLVVLAANLLLMGFVSNKGYEFVGQDHGFSNALNVAVILLVVGIAARMLTTDNLNLLNALGEKIAQVEQAKQLVQYQAEHDYLTKLPNRMMAEKIFEQIMHRLERGDFNSAGAIYVDFDEFKAINDNLGHSTGDEFLVEKAKSMQQALGGVGTVCRIGGDEFLILIEDIGVDELAMRADAINQEVMRELNIDGHLLHCTSSIGIVRLPTDAVTYEQAVQRADIAMYRAKKAGKNQVQFYDQTMETTLQRRYSIQNRLSTALLEKEFSIALQPIIDIDSGKMVGAEALARWQHSAFGAISPMEFIPIAESSGTIDELSAFVLEQTCSVLALVLKTQADFYVSINISPIQLRNEAFFAGCQAIVNKYGLPASALKFEITETQIIERDPIFDANIRKIQDSGIGLLLDDFGTGYSNLSHMQKMNFETIKIDRSFIFACYKNMDTKTLLRSITAMAEQLDVDIVAEGIEDEHELHEVKRLGIQKGQGYYWSKPLPVADFMTTYFSPK